MKYKLNDNLYTIIGVLVVIGGIIAALFTSGIFNKDENLENSDSNDNGEIIDSPIVEDEIIPEIDPTPEDSTNTTPEKDPVKDNSTTTNDNTNNNSENNTTNGNTNNQGNTGSNQGTTSTSDVLSCSMTSEESGVKTVAVCDNVFASGYLSTQTCTMTVTSSDKTVLDQQYQLLKLISEGFATEIGDKTAMNSTVTYDNNKVVLTQFTDLKKTEAILANSDGSMTIDVSSKNTKADVNKILTAQGYTCK